MIEPPRLGRGHAPVFRSQLALELGLHAYAFLGAAILLRFLLLILGVEDRVWVGATIYGITDPFVWPLTLLPGSDRELLGSATLPDVTMVALVALVPLWLMARGAKRGAA